MTANYPKRGPFLESAVWENIGEDDEGLRVVWKKHADTSETEEFFFEVDKDIFLEDISGSDSLTKVPADHLRSSLHGQSIMSGLPLASKEIIDLTDQDTKHLQTIIGNVKIKEINMKKSTTSEPGSVHTVTFQKVGASSNTLDVDMDVTEIQRYDPFTQRARSVQCIPGALKKEFDNMKASDLGPAGSQNRIDVIDFLMGSTDPNTN